MRVSAGRAAGQGVPGTTAHRRVRRDRYLGTSVVVAMIRGSTNDPPPKAPPPVKPQRPDDIASTRRASRGSRAALLLTVHSASRDSRPPLLRCLDATATVLGAPTD